MANGHLEFDSDNYMLFTQDFEDDDEPEFDVSHMLEWDEDPIKFADNLRKAADFLEQNAHVKFRVAID